MRLATCTLLVLDGALKRAQVPGRQRCTQFPPRRIHPDAQSAEAEVAKEEEGREKAREGTL